MISFFSWIRSIRSWRSRTLFHWPSWVGCRRVYRFQSLLIYFVSLRSFFSWIPSEKSSSRWDSNFFKKKGPQWTRCKVAYWIAPPSEGLLYPLVVNEHLNLSFSFAYRSRKASATASLNGFWSLTQSSSFNSFLWEFRLFLFRRDGFRMDVFPCIVRAFFCFLVHKRRTSDSELSSLSKFRIPKLEKFS